VGIGLCGDSGHVYFFPRVSSGLVRGLRGKRLIGHNLKGDAHWLRKWGFSINPRLFAYDTLLAAHLLDSSRSSYSLKDIAADYLGWQWPSYSDMVHPDPEHPKKKITLDAQETERVARYCGTDVLATFKLTEYFQTKLSPDQRLYVEELELPMLRILYQMEERGIMVDVEKLRTLDREWALEEGYWEDEFQAYFNEPVNIRSPKQVLEALTKFSSKTAYKPLSGKGPVFSLKSTNSKHLEKYKDRVCVKELLQYRAINKLRSTYTTALLELPTMPRVHTTFNQWGTITGRLSSSDPNLQNIPVRTENGKELRKAFIASPGNTLIIADYSQIEYRFLAHLSEEPVLLNSFRNGKDVHEETAKVLGIDRRLGKTLNFAAIYGAQAPKIAQTAGISVQEADRFLKRYWQRLPKAAAWINKAKLLARQRGGIYTMLRRFIALPDINLKCENISPCGSGSFQRRACKSCYMRWTAERCAVSYEIQGSAAELIKKAMVELDKEGLKPILQVHDELVFDVEECDSDFDECAKHGDRLRNIERIMTNVMKLDVPIEVSIATGPNWGVKE